MKEDLINPYLFGNEAGEDEDKQRLSDYYLEKEKNKAFYDRKRKIGFVRARKGVGKSALLNYTALKVEEENKKDIIINIKASEPLRPPSRSDSSYGRYGLAITTPSSTASKASSPTHPTR